MKKLLKKRKNLSFVKVTVYAGEAGNGCTNNTCQGAGGNCANKSVC